jgi:hypothetical protein
MIAGRASVVWQTSFAKRDGLRVDAFNSPALQRLAAALDDDDVLGLTVRFNAYRTIYFDDPTLRNGTPAEQQAFVRLADKLTGGGFQPNPARSLLVGVVGLWRKGEPAHEPGDRVLCAPGVPFTVASAFARLDDKTLTLDLSNSVPENAVDLSKQDLGPLTVEAVDAAGHATSLGTISPSQYGRDAYVASAGIVVIPLAAGAATAAAGTTLRLRDQNGGNLLVETALRAIPDMPNRYLGEGDDVTATFQLYDRGVPKAAQVPITVYKMSANGRTIAATSQMATDANGILSIPITGAAGMIFALVLVPQGAGGPPTGGINTQVNTYMYVRVLPADANVGMMAPTWDNVYAHVLANWNAMAPCMDNWLMLDDPVQVKARAAMLKQLTDPANFENLRFMPITRDMTKGERTLLYKFLDAPGAPLLTAAAAPPPAEDLAALSRSMRRPPGARRT